MPSWMDPPGKPWRLPLIVLGLPVAIVVLIEGLHLTQLVSTWCTWIR